MLSLHSKLLLTNDKMRKFYFAILSIAFISIVSCSQDDEVTTGEDGSTRQVRVDNDIVRSQVDTVIGQTAYFTAYIKSDGLTIKRRRFVYSLTKNDPKIGSAGCLQLYPKEEGDTITAQLTMVKTDTYYYYRAYIITTTDTIYGNVDSVKVGTLIPQIETLPVTNRVRVAAVALGHVISRGNVKSINELGICINHIGFPTLKDQHIAAIDTATDDTYKGQFGVFFDNLTANTMYHVRSYCVYTVNDGKDTIYGNDRIFKTTLGGDVHWSWGSKSGDDEVDARIAQALDSAMYYYNNYSNLYHRITANYGASTPTADCSITGWMRFGPNSYYQWVGTAQHEITHAMGVGTAYNWSSFGDPWSKPIANQTVRVMLKDMSLYIHGAYCGQIHFWPGGINYRHEVENPGTSNSKGVVFSGPYMLKVNAMICNALREDGLATHN